MSKAKKTGRMTMREALQQYERTPKDRREDRRGAEQIMKRTNAKRAKRG